LRNCAYSFFTTRSCLVHQSITVDVINFMKIHSTYLRFSLQFGLCLAACLPLTSHAGVEVPYWLYPEWIAARVMDFHTRNTERIELAQAQAKTKSNANSTMAVNSDQNQQKPTLAPVETATPKINEKHLSKEELIELRKQLRQK
jgi:hypothetical protein